MCHTGIKIFSKGRKKVREGKNDRIKLKGSVRLRVKRETLEKEVSSVRPQDCRVREPESEALRRPDLGMSDPQTGCMAHGQSRSVGGMDSGQLRRHQGKRPNQEAGLQAR